ncbi:unnamed protein product [Phaeothamnion confervicola]
MDFVGKWTNDYLWHRERFSLSVHVPANGVAEPHLRGLTVVGDSVDEEWFITFLVYEITKRFPSIAASITDGDGEFLLIEAARELPPFLDPSNSANRVWVRRGRLHFVLPGTVIDQGPASPREVSGGRLPLADGLAAVRQGADTEAASAVQAAIARRIDAYPGRIASSRHNVRCFLPPAVAAALRTRPALVAAAVRAYCASTPAEAAAAARMESLGGHSRGGGGVNSCAASSGGGTHAAGGKLGPAACVELRVAFTQHLFARLHHARPIHAPITFPDGWGPPRSERLTAAERAKAAAVGTRLAMGMEIAYRRCRQRCEKHGGASEAAAAAATAAALERVLARLTEVGYFDGLVRGSQAYNEKAEAARKMLQRRQLSAEASPQSRITGAATGVGGDDDDNDDEQGGSEDGGSGGSDEEEDVGGADAAELLDGPFHDLHKFIDAAAADAAYAGGGSAGGSSSGDGVFPPVVVADDSEGWMAVSAAALEAELAEQFTGLEPAGVGADDTGRALDDLLGGFMSFVDDEEAGLDGAEVPQGAVDFDFDRFMQILAGKDKAGGGGGGGGGENEESDDGSYCEDIAQAAGTGKSEAAASGEAAAGGANGQQRSNGFVEVMGLDSDDEMETTPAESAAPAPAAAAGGPAPSAGAALAAAESASAAEEQEEEGDAEIMRHLMEAMDLELEGTAVGQTFEKRRAVARATLDRLKTVGPLAVPMDDDSDTDVAPGLGSYGTGAGADRMSGGISISGGGGGSDGEGGGGFGDGGGGGGEEEVDVDMNLVKHLLESLASQGGRPGPASSLLREMGVGFQPPPPPPAGEGDGDSDGEGDAI